MTSRIPFPTHSHWKFFSPAEPGGAILHLSKTLARGSETILRSELKQLLQILENGNTDPNMDDGQGMTLLEAVLGGWEHLRKDIHNSGQPRMYHDVSVDPSLAKLPLKGEPEWDGAGVVYPWELPAATLLARGANPFPDGRVDLLKKAMESNMASVILCMLRHPERPSWDTLSKAFQSHFRYAWEAPLLLEALLAGGWPVDQKDLAGRSLLAQCPLKGWSSREGVTLLLKYGANPFEKDNLGKSIVEVWSDNFTLEMKLPSELGTIWMPHAAKATEKNPDLTPEYISGAVLAGWGNKLPESGKLFWNALSEEKKDDVRWNILRMATRRQWPVNIEEKTHPVWQDVPDFGNIQAACHIINSLFGGGKYRTLHNNSSFTPTPNFGGGKYRTLHNNSSFTPTPNYPQQTLEKALDTLAKIMDPHSDEWMFFISSMVKRFLHIPFPHEVFLPHLVTVLEKECQRTTPFTKDPEHGEGEYLHITLEILFGEYHNLIIPHSNQFKTNGQVEVVAQVIFVWSTVAAFSLNQPWAGQAWIDLMMETPQWQKTDTGIRLRKIALESQEGQWESLRLWFLKESMDIPTKGPIKNRL